MSGRRSRGRQQGSARISDDQILELVSTLQQLLPDFGSNKVSTIEVLQESCNYIRNLHKELEDLSERLTALLGTADSAQAQVIRRLLER